MRHRRSRRPWTDAVAAALARVPDREIEPRQLVSLVLLFTGVTALLLGPSPAGRYVGHRLTGSSAAAARAAHGAAPAPAGAPGTDRAGGAGSQQQAASPAPSGGAAAPKPSGPASPS